MRTGILLLWVLTAIGCDNGAGSGRVQVFAVPEDTITAGLEPGTDEENIKDGWSVTYSKYLVSIGDVHATRSADPNDKLAESKVYLLDMQKLPSDGFVLATFDKATAARYDKVGFDLPNAFASAIKPDSTSQADYDMMVTNGYSLYVEATLSKTDGQSCRPTAPTDCVPRDELTVEWGVRAGTAFDDCAPPMGDAGFAVPTGGTVQVKPTIHGDHWFFSNITQGAEITSRLAQWIVNSDLDRNGETTIDELKAVKAADVFSSPTYNLSGAIIPIDSAYDYLVAQAHTLGDYQGDGECPTRKILQ
jgi:hypothetical protein